MDKRGFWTGGGLGNRVGIAAILYSSTGEFPEGYSLERLIASREGPEEKFRLGKQFMEISDKDETTLAVAGSLAKDGEQEKAEALRSLLEQKRRNRSGESDAIWYDAFARAEGVLPGGAKLVTPQAGGVYVQFEEGTDPALAQDVVDQVERIMRPVESEAIAGYVGDEGQEMGDYFWPVGAAGPEREDGNEDEGDYWGYSGTGEETMPENEETLLARNLPTSYSEDGRMPYMPPNQMDDPSREEVRRVVEEFKAERAYWLEEEGHEYGGATDAWQNMSYAIIPNVEYGELIPSAGELDEFNRLTGFTEDDPEFDVDAAVDFIYENAPLWREEIGLYTLEESMEDYAHRLGQPLRKPDEALEQGEDWDDYDGGRGGSSGPLWHENSPRVRRRRARVAGSAPGTR